jgi:hypothetical protein
VVESRQDQPWTSVSGFWALEDSEMNLSGVAGDTADTISLGYLELNEEARSGEGRSN